MKLTETRKAIIELIEPFMDKTLSEGCYIRERDSGDICILGICDGYSEKRVIFNDSHYGVLLRTEYSKSDEINREITKMRDRILQCDLEDSFRFDIVWNYEITAVLKFIEKNCAVMVRFDLGEEDWKDIIYVMALWSSNVLFQFPNKPLHLYTEEEDKQLLEILTNLVKND